MGMIRKHFTVVFLCLCFTVFLLLISVSSSSSPQGQMETAASRSLEHDNGVHCSRERSRAAWKIIDEYLMPFVEKERYKISSRCRLHPENDLYRDQEQHKMHVDINEWRCGYCKKTFYEEKYLDKHFDNRHYDLLNVSHSRPKCNPAAIGRNKHLCESLADSCFPVSEGPSALHLNEFFLRQFCDAHTCSGGRKPFSKGGKRETSTLHVVISVLVLMLLALFYIFIYLYRGGIKRGSQGLKHISKSGQKKRLKVIFMHSLNFSVEKTKIVQQ
ncbi:ZINC FINGER PROTEIN-RELATED [Salix koriyanagi]|uniref:ZINC FINGER PROTEIN-RELATED n=1 Tax=Salix koriyanagi TaxID=2511006 RepID=A0A9Q0X2L9_9ROSI|nr:ZINC FINGER PROTEIN-RELATED [Salix koriyanagi]